MKFETYYDRPTRTWYAMIVDENGYQIGEAQNAYTKDEAIFYIGVEYGRNQHKFARPLSEIAD